MKKIDVIIIGSGLVGSMIKQYLLKQGLTVQTIDARDKFSASKCSAGVWKDGWIEGIKEQAYAGIDILTDFVQAEEIKMLNDKGVEEPFYYVNRDKILLSPDVLGTVNKIVDKTVHFYNNITGERSTMKAEIAVVVAAGYKTPMIINSSLSGRLANVDSVWGKVFEFTGQIATPRISIWAPYRQAYVFNQNKASYYFGDGCTVKNPTNEFDKRLTTAGDRLITHAMDLNCDFADEVISKEGFRPYLDKNVSMVNVYGGIIAAVGTAKNGTVLCGYIAKEVSGLVKKAGKGKIFSAKA